MDLHKENILKIIKEREGGVKTRFASKVGVATGNLSDWLSGRTKPSAGVAYKIKDIYGIDVYKPWPDASEPPNSFANAEKISIASYYELKGKFEYAHQINQEFFERLETVLHKCEEVAGDRGLKADRVMEAGKARVLKS